MLKEAITVNPGLELFANFIFGYFYLKICTRKIVKLPKYIFFC